MGCVMEYVINDANDTPDFLVGEALVGSWSPLRNMENPPLDGRSIGSLSDYCDGLGVHFSSGVLNKAFVTAVRACVTNGCLGVDALSECVLLVGPLFLYANIEQLTTLSTFADAALQTCVVVDEFLTTLAAYNTCDKDTLAQFVIDGWESVGITIDSTACGSVTAVDTKTCSSGGGGGGGGGGDGGGTFTFVFLCCYYFSIFLTYHFHAWFVFILRRNMLLWRCSSGCATHGTCPYERCADWRSN